MLQLVEFHDLHVGDRVRWSHAGYRGPELFGKVVEIRSNSVVLDWDRGIGPVNMGAFAAEVCLVLDPIEQMVFALGSESFSVGDVL